MVDFQAEAIHSLLNSQDCVLAIRLAKESNLSVCFRVDSKYSIKQENGTDTSFTIGLEGKFTAFSLYIQKLSHYNISFSLSHVNPINK